MDQASCSGYTNAHKSAHALFMPVLSKSPLKVQTEIVFRPSFVLPEADCFRIGDLDFVYRHAMLAIFTSCECVRCESGHDSTVCRSHPTRVDAARFRGSRQPWKDRTTS